MAEKNFKDPIDCPQCGGKKSVEFDETVKTQWRCRACGMSIDRGYILAPFVICGGNIIRTDPESLAKRKARGLPTEFIVKTLSK